MAYKRHDMEELRNMFDKERDCGELNKIISAIIGKQEVPSDDNEEINNVQLEREIYQQMNLIKLEDLNGLEKTTRKMDKKIWEIGR